MAWNPFGKKKSEGEQPDTGDDAAQTSSPDPQAQSDTATAEKGKKKGKKDPRQELEEMRDPRKASRWFEQAKTVADTGNHDYAVECYINGLKFDPESLKHHELLHEVALRRKVAGGKPAGIKDQFKHSGGKNPIEKMLNAEFLWAKKPDDPSLALGVMEQAAALDMEEVTYWIGNITLLNNKKTKRPSKGVYSKACDLFAKVGAFDKAVEACKQIVAMDPMNSNVLQKLKDLEAERTIMEGRYGEEGGSFRDALKDSAGAKAMEQGDRIAQSAEALQETIDRLRDEYEENLEDPDRLMKLVRALLQRGDKEAEDEAIKWLEDGYERFGTYQHKMQIGDIRMRQFNRTQRDLKDKLAKTEGEADKAQVKEQLKRLRGAQVKFELSEYQERAKAYPTDMKMRFELGKRQFFLQDFDEAIANFQEAQSDPKYRAMSLRFLGEAFARKEWYDEAIDTYHRAIEVHPYNDDRLALELRYNLMAVLDYKAREDQDLPSAQEALKIASQIAQANINYHDIRDRVEDLRKLVNELKQGTKSA